VPFVKAKRAQSDTDDETWEAGRPSPTLNALDSGETRATTVIAFSHTQGLDEQSSETATPTLRKGGGGAAVSDTGVRRLTPVECARLQGFPDNWTDVCSDSQRYKQMGNAVAVPVVEWIAHRIAERAA
jgi:DNA (cytosine-5)-methyltransferase 1